MLIRMFSLAFLNKEVIAQCYICSCSSDIVSQ